MSPGAEIIPLARHRFARARGAAYAASLAAQRCGLPLDQQRRVVDATSRAVLAGTSAARALADAYRSIRRGSPAA